MIAISLKDISKTYTLYENATQRLKELFFGKKLGKPFNALDGITLDIEQGVTLGLVGKNGAGKSTLLKIITGVVTPSRGTLNVNGRISSLLELGAGFNPDYNGIENIYLNSRLSGLSDKEIDLKVPEILKFADIGEHIYQPVKTYSSGMFARLAFSLAINVDPDILIVDEALSVGDVFFQIKCYAKFEEFQKAGKTILFVTHDMGTVIKYCTKAVLIDHGKMIEYAEPARIVDSYKRLLTGNYTPDDKRLDQFDELNYGNKKAEIFDYQTLRLSGDKADLFQLNEEFIIEYKVKFNEDLDNPVFAFAVFDRKGTEITGINTYFEKIQTGNYKKDEVVKVRFRQSLPLQQGEYLINLGCVGLPGGDVEVFSRVYYGLRIEIISTKTVCGMMYSPSEVTIERE